VYDRRRRLGNPFVMALTPDEDADLRRLASFDRLGFLEMRGRTRLSELRGRDRREQVRPVEDSVEHLSTLQRGGVRARGARCTIYPG
jgi:hypothetical protein